MMIKHSHMVFYVMWRKHSLAGLLASLIVFVSYLIVRTMTPEPNPVSLHGKAMHENTADWRGGQEIKEPRTEKIVPLGIIQPADNTSAESAAKMSARNRQLASVAVSDNGATEADNKQDTVSLLARVIAQPGRTAVRKRAYEIPEGWHVVAAQITNKKGRAHIFERDGYMILEVHALSPNKSERAEAYAEATITIKSDPPK